MKRHTCNATEAQGVANGLVWLGSQPEVRMHSTLVVAGDSRLITDFLAHRAKPGNPVLVGLLGEAREAARKL